MENNSTLTVEEQSKRNSLKTNKPYVYEKIQKFDGKIRRGESIAVIQMQYNYVCNNREKTHRQPDANIGLYG